MLDGGLVTCCCKRKLSSDPVRASITLDVTGGMLLLAALVNGSSVAPAHWRLMPWAYVAKWACFHLVQVFLWASRPSHLLVSYL
jgi:hypothetical protein